jgi:hypothetical protein
LLGYGGMGNASDPRDLDERIGWIKASIRSRVSELSRRVDRVRDATDLSVVTRHPWVTVGIAFAAGALLAASRRPRSEPHRESILGASLRTILVSVAATYGRKLAQDWMESHFHGRQLEGHDVRARAPGVTSTPSRDIH